MSQAFPSSGYWPSSWPAEDAGPLRQQVAAGAFAGVETGDPRVVSRDAHGATMVVRRDSGEVFLHGHSVGGESFIQTSWVERINPTTLETLSRVDELPGGSAWPGGIAAHADGSLIVVFGNHAHRLNTRLEVEVSVELPRDRPYNSFVVLPDGHIVTKDFGGRLPGADASFVADNCEVLVLSPTTLEIVSRVQLSEPSIARLSADGNTVYVVGDHSLFRVEWNGTSLELDATFAPRYRTIEGQTYGWDAVLALGAGWFLDNGGGSENYVGTFRGQGISPAPLHLVRVDLETAAVSLTEICGLPNGMVANPPLIDERRMIAVGFDSANGVLAAFDIDSDGSTSPRWSVEQNHGSHMILDPTSGLFLSAHHDNERWMEQFVVREIASGREVVRLDSGSPLQSVVFPAAGEDRTVYACSFSTVSALSW
ncbi:unannotated protein [freshwater metagenome]|uniref:Unannotated protein n=1 Tax=freshwater metagenome TaxID=449393 RepID=A0A6J6BU93_9ZZZZ|nr:hypothetical protein [Actinomycetota bacterium]MSZ13717.1 hypothetical protein [Actinomycetota bacterium]MTA18080.1 hypothetical protein [Actinomycetota bacterium]MTA87659.1 hypothetical protein [Actinomycetota bacterium]MTB01319.1 hypothetical protein [Actinomycetota bacterium]